MTRPSLSIGAWRARLPGVQVRPAGESPFIPAIPQRHPHVWEPAYEIAIAALLAASGVRVVLWRYKDAEDRECCPAVSQEDLGTLDRLICLLDRIGPARAIALARAGRIGRAT